MWGSWGICNQQTGKQERTFIISNPGDAEGDACPTKETQNCPVNCQSTWSVWTPSTCAKTTFTQQTRSSIETVASNNGGAACPADETRPCSPCQFTWAAWSACDQTTGTQTRQPLITAQPSEYDGQNVGDACPGPETQDCPVNCKGAYGPWTDCTSLIAMYPPFKRTRQNVQLSPAINGGLACPGPEEEPCVPAVCYSAESAAASFAKKMKMRPLNSFPSGHPVQSRTDCGSALPTDSKIPASDCSTNDVGGYTSWYAQLAGTKKSASTLSIAGTSRLFFLQDDAARLGFGFLNGKGTSNNNAADYDMKFTQWFPNSAPAGTPPARWAVQNDPTTASTSCKNNGGTDCYSFDSSKMKAEVGWSWSNGGADESSGGVFGPLPSYGFCITITAGDVSGIDHYEFASSGGTSSYIDPQKFNGEAFDYALKVCTYLCPEFESTGVVVPPSSGGGNSGGNSGGGGGSNGGHTGGGGKTGGTVVGAGAEGDSGGSDEVSVDGDGGGDSATATGDDNASGGDSIVPASCSSGVVNAAGDGCDSTCDTGVVNSAGNGCEGTCSKGVVNAAGDGCEDADATFAAPGTFESAGIYTPESASADATSVGGIDGSIGFIIVGVLCLIGIAAFFVHQQKKKKKSTVNDLPDGWSSFVDPASGYPCYVDPEGTTHWEKPEASHPIGLEMQTVHNPMGCDDAAASEVSHSRTGTILPEGWGKDESDPNAKYYYNKSSGETAWEAPPGSSNVGGKDSSGLLNPSHARSETILPSNWAKDVSDPSQKYYYNDSSGETAWVAPEGSTGGSTGL
jgi:hypothetical protein